MSPNKGAGSTDFGPCPSPTLTENNDGEFIAGRLSVKHLILQHSLIILWCNSVIVSHTFGMHICGNNIIGWSWPATAETENGP